MYNRLQGIKPRYWIIAAAGLLVLGWFIASDIPREDTAPAPDRSDAPAVTMDIKGMYCASCKQNVERSLRGLEGVEHVAVDLKQEEAKLWTTQTAELSDEVLQQTVTEAGYEPGEIRRP